MTAPLHPHTAQEQPTPRQIPLGDLILAALVAAYHQGAVCARRDSSAEAMRAATSHSMRASDDMWRAFAQVVDTLAAIEAVHARYFDLDGRPGFDDTTPEPEDVWRYDRDFRAALKGAAK